MKGLRTVKSKHSLILLVLALFVLFSISALPVSADDNALVRVVHASPGAGNVDVFVDGIKLLDNFQFGTVTDYVPVPAGSHTVQVAPAGKGINAAVITQTLSVNPGIVYTVAALGTTSTGFSLVAFVDNNQVSPGRAKVRVYHLSPDAGPVDVSIGGNKLIAGLIYRQVSNYFTVPTGTFTYNVATTHAKAIVPLTATLRPNTVISIFAIGLLSGTPKLFFVVKQVPGIPGMPGTGSDPNVAPANSQPLNPWLLGSLLSLIVIMAGLTMRRLVLARQKTTLHSHD
jgi:hypothetical protein